MSTLAVREQTITRLRGSLSAIEAGANRTRMRLERDFQREVTLQLRLWFRELARELRARLEIEVRRAALLRLQNPFQKDYVEAVRDALETFSRPLIVDALDGERRRRLQRIHNRWYRIMYEFGAVSALQLMRVVAGSSRVKRALSKQADEFVFELTDQEIIAGIELRSIEFGAGITAEVIEDARRMVRDGVYFGTDTTQKVAGRIADAQGIPEWRGLKIARTESQQAISTARHAMYARSGVPQHTWFSVGDRRVRPEHVLNDGVKVRVGEEFPSGQLHTGDGTLSVNCRCTIIPDLSDPNIVIQPWDGSAGPTIGREVPEVPRPSTRPRRLTVPRMREIAQESNISIPPGADKAAILGLISRHFRTTGTRPPQI